MTETDRLRVLDALFAERVLGLDVIGDAVTGERLIASPKTRGLIIVRPGDPLPTFTRSLDAAWEGATRIGWEIEFTRLDDLVRDDWKCRVHLREEDIESFSSGVWSHPAEALVLACLRAVGVDESELA